MNRLTQIANRGIIFSIGVLFNRLVPKWLFRCRYFVVYELAANHAPQGLEKVTIRQLVIPAEREKLKTITHNELPTDAMSRHIGFAVNLDEQIIGGAWVAQNEFTEDELGIRYRLPHQSAWIYSTGITKPFRRLGHYDSLLHAMTRELSQSGSQPLRMAVNPYNRASRRAHEKHSKARIAKVFAIRFLNFAFCFAAGKLGKDRFFSANAKRNPIQITFLND